MEKWNGCQFSPKLYHLQSTNKRCDQIQEVPVCYKAFLSIFGITKGKLEHLQKSLKETGIAPKDRRGKSSAHKKLDMNTKQLICTHIKSFKGRQSRSDFAFL